MSSQVPPYLVLSLNSRRVLVERPHTFKEAIERARKTFPEISQAETLSFITDDLAMGCGQVEVAPSAWKLLAAEPSFKEATIQRNIQSSTSPPPILNPQPIPHPQTLAFGRSNTTIQAPEADNVQHSWVSALAQGIIQKIQELPGIIAKPPQLLFGHTDVQDQCSLESYDHQGCSPQPVMALPLSMRIYIRTLQGKNRPFVVKATDSIYSLKEQYEFSEGLPVPEQDLMFAGEVLEDGYTLSDYNIGTGSVLHQVDLMRGLKPVIYLFPPSPLEGAIVDLSNGDSPPFTQPLPSR